MSLKHFGGGQPDTTTQPHTHAHTMSHWHTHTHLPEESESFRPRFSGHIRLWTETCKHGAQRGFYLWRKEPTSPTCFYWPLSESWAKGCNYEVMSGWRSADSWLCNVVFTCKKVIVLCSFVYQDWRIQFFFKARSGAEQGISISAHFIINSLEC